MNTFVDDNSFNVYRYGTYYNPAFRQYNLTTMVNVICDRCHKNYLNVCIGWNNKNLCLECVNMIDSFVLAGIITQGIPYNTQPYNTQPYASTTTVTSYSPVSTVTPMSQFTQYTPIAPVTSYTPIATITPVTPTMY